MQIGYEESESIYPKRSTDLSHLPEIRGLDHEKEFSLERWLDAMKHTGIQASNFAKAVEIVRKMRADGAKIFLGFTSNMISSGVRESIKYLVKHKMVDVVVSMVGGIEEDIIKTLEKFRLGRFDAPGKTLFEMGVNRIGNIFVTNNHYTKFEFKMKPFMEGYYEKHKGEVTTVSQFLRELGLYVNHEDSFLYWAAKNKIPVFCPVITDGAVGDLTYFFKKKHPDFHLDITGDMTAIVDESLNAEKVGVIILGGGAMKHHIMNAQIFRGGADYAVYINTADFSDASDSGGDLEEAMSWEKINPDSDYVKVHAEVSLVFALLVELAFKNQNHQEPKSS